MSARTKIQLPEDRYFGPDPGQKKVALALYQTVKNLPLVCPHGHVDPRLFAEPDYQFGNPAELLIIPDHYVFRMLYSQGIPLENVGVPRVDGGAVEGDPRRIWQTFADNFYLFRGTPTGMWFTQELHDVFGITAKLTGESANDIYDELAEKLTRPEFKPRPLFEAFNIEVLCTTDAATDPLDYHQALRASGWNGQIRPTFRPDAVVNLDTSGWKQNIEALSQVSGISVTDYDSFIEVLEQRRTFFKEMGATATDHAVLTPHTEALSQAEADTIFQHALQGKSTQAEARQFTGHMLIELARMSTEDGLVMQIHPGSFRSHNRQVFEQFGVDKGADIPLPTNFTRELHTLLNKFGNNPQLSIILFTLDETTYARELAPLAGHYPCLKLGPPWWFFDSWNGMHHFFDQVMETAGIYNTAGFNDDTRAFPSIPARHDMWRRACANWVAGLVVRSVVDMDDALAMIRVLAYDLAKQAYNLDSP